MQSQPRTPLYRAFRATGRVLVGVLVVGYAVLDAILSPLFGPLVRGLSRLRLFEAIGGLLLKLPPYVVLLILAVPFVLLEPLKVFALYWFALGHIVQGAVLLVIAHGLSILTLERLYQAGKPQLMRIGWFSRIMGWLGGLRDAALAFARSTGAWRWGASVIVSVKGRASRLVRGLRRPRLRGGKLPG